MPGVLEQFPLLMAALKEELKRELREELGAGVWIDQEQSVLGRNRHVAACKRLIRRDSPDAYYDGTEGRWLLRASALDQEITRRNHELAERLPKTEPPPALVKTTPPEGDDDGTGIYERALDRLRRVR